MLFEGPKLLILNRIFHFYLVMFIIKISLCTGLVAPHSNTLAWRIPWTEEPGGLRSMGSLTVREDWATSLSLFTFMHWRRKWQPTPGFLPGESQGRGAWWAAVSGVAQSRTQLKQLSSSSSTSLRVLNSRELHSHFQRSIFVLEHSKSCSETQDWSRGKITV